MIKGVISLFIYFFVIAKVAKTCNIGFALVRGIIEISSYIHFVKVARASIIEISSYICFVHGPCPCGFSLKFEHTIFNKAFSPSVHQVLNISWLTTQLHQTQGDVQFLFSTAIWYQDLASLNITRNPKMNHFSHKSEN